MTKVITVSFMFIFLVQNCYCTYKLIDFLNKKIKESNNRVKEINKKIKELYL
jgi:cell division protein FtsL